MTLTTAQWHQRYIHQAQWTQSIREYIFSKVGIGHSTRLLDIGCGTGVIDSEINSRFSTSPYAIDLDYKVLQFAQVHAPNCHYYQADGRNLPFSDHSFEISLCHFVLLWIANPLKALEEMIRVTCPDGYILALAEPDYGGRIDFPVELSKIGQWQAESLKKQGANPYIGRELKYLFHQAGLADIVVGVLGGQWINEESDQEHSSEWDVIEADLLQINHFTNQWRDLKNLDQQALENGQRILFVPTFYAYGKVRG
jgi:ubiquinone/menaquinone biosynthesis C-methylase UbiE